MSAQELRLLNFGCGSTAHPAWTNLDVSPALPGVIAHDLQRAFPFPNQSYDAVYGSHVLEHLEPDQAGLLLHECYRILKPGGIVRIVVPDLEVIVRLYLQTLEKLLAGGCECEAQYDWIMLELYDQIVRNCSGGRMAAYLSTELSEAVKDFIKSRIGVEALQSKSDRVPGIVPRKGLPQRVMARLLRGARAMRQIAAEGCLALFLGRKGVRALRQGLFRMSGEAHQWMYDRFSLRRALERTGFGEIRVCAADESAIPEFHRFGLETLNGAPVKPDSMFIEGRKPGGPVSAFENG